jgi:putative transposase
MGRQVTAGGGGVYDLGYHVVWCPVVWCPKYRRAVLTGPVRQRLDALLREKCAGHDWPMVTLEIEPDHVHLFVRAHPRHSLSSVANQLRGFTSQVLRGEFPHLRSDLPTLWSRSYVVATVGAVSAESVTRYIETRNERPWRSGDAR